jgi:hypothetical protein
MDSIKINFEDHFNKENISLEKIMFARDYVENLIGADIDEDPIIEISPIGSIVFGYLVAHIVDEYEMYKESKMDGFNI